MISSHKLRNHRDFLYLTASISGSPKELDSGKFYLMYSTNICGCKRLISGTCNQTESDRGRVFHCTQIFIISSSTSCDKLMVQYSSNLISCCCMFWHSYIRCFVLDWHIRHIFSITLKFCEIFNVKNRTSTKIRG